MSKFNEIYKSSINTSRLILVFKADETWNEDIYCKPCPKRSYAYWIAEMTELENISESETKKMLGTFAEVMAKLVCLCTCTESGEPVFDYNTDIDVLCELDDSNVLEALFMGACQANGIESLATEFKKVFSNIDEVFDSIADAFNENENGAAKKSTAKKPRAKKAS